MPRKRIAFGWFGGKYSHLNWLLPLLPTATHYCEPYGGSAAVLLNRPPAPVETYNDLDNHVAHFFSVLRDHKDELIYAIGMTPFSRAEFVRAIDTISDCHVMADIERARRFFIRARQVRSGLAQRATGGQWAYCIKTSNYGMAGAVSRWLGSVEGLDEVALRLLRVQIEYDDAGAVIQRYDSSETLFYCDPPYPIAARSRGGVYRYEMSDQQHQELAELLSSIKGKAAVSGYHCALLNDLYAKWNVHEEGAKRAGTAHLGSRERSEVLWTNY